MAVYKYLVIMCSFSLFCVMCQLNLSEDSPCTSDKKYNGTCVRLNKCGSAVLTYLYRNAGFNESELPSLPDICSNKNIVPVVCCTDCVFNNRDEFKDSAVAPHGILVSRRGPTSWKKCLDYFNRLPYPCHGEGKVDLKKTWKEDYRCHDITLKVSLSVGGHYPETWMFPHLALLGYGDNASPQWLCEGTVISEKFILTAARCTNAGVLGNVAFAAVGLKSRTSPVNPWNLYSIKRIVIHPEYNEPSWYHDIALLETEIEIRFDTNILPACLDVGIHDVSVAETAGLPIQASNKTIPEDLQLIYMEQLTRFDCSTIYRPSNTLIHGFNQKIQMCYGSRNHTLDTCKRVAGSPLQIDQFKCQYTVTGVTAHTKECGKPHVPDFYTRIQYYVPWIEKIVWPKED